MANFTQQDQLPVFYFLDIRDVDSVHVLPLIPKKWQKRDVFIVMPPNKVYLLGKTTDKFGNECLSLTPCKDVICAKPKPLAPPQERPVNYPNEQ